MNGSPFYVNAAVEVVLDPQTRPTVQNTLLAELQRCEELVQRDYRYAHLVAGSSKMPMAMIWSVRNQDELVNDADLATFKDLAWTEFVKKRFLPSVAEASVCASAASMLEIVRDMNLQRRRFQIMGLHEQVEASEIQLVLHLCQAGIVRTAEYRKTANRFRRSDRTHEAFALAVGATVCATAPLTLGAATPRYERDLQYEYRKNAIALLVYVLQQNQGDAGLEEDYVARIARMIVVAPGCQRVVGAAPAAPSGGDDNNNAALSTAVAIAQRDAAAAASTAKETEAELRAFIAGNNRDLGLGKQELAGRIAEVERRVQTDALAMATHLQTHDTTLTERVEGLRRDLQTFQVRQAAHNDRAGAELTQIGARNQEQVMGIMLGILNGRGGDAAAAIRDQLATNTTTAVQAQVQVQIAHTLGAIEARLAALEARPHAAVVQQAPAPVFTLPSVGASQHEIQALADNYGRLYSQVQGLDRAINTTAPTLARAAAEATNAAARVAALEARADGVDAKLNEGVANLAGRIAPLETAVVARVAALEARADTLDGAIQHETATRTEGMRRLTEAAAAAQGANTTNVRRQNEQIQSIREELAAAEAEVAAATAAMASLNTVIDTRATAIAQQVADPRRYDAAVSRLEAEVRAAVAAMGAGTVPAVNYDMFQLSNPPDSMGFMQP